MYMKTSREDRNVVTIKMKQGMKLEKQMHVVLVLTFAGGVLSVTLSFLGNNVNEK